MATHLLFFFSVSILFLAIFSLADGGSIGVNYGRIAGDLPSASKVVKLLKSQGIDRVKVYDTDPAVLRSLAGTGIKVTVNLPNEFLYAAARRRSFAYGWVRRNVVAYYPNTRIEAIAVGNEVFVDPKNTTGFLIPAMKNIHQAIVKYNLHSDIKLSSPVALSALQNSYPSSAGSFRPELIEPVFKPMFEFLRQTGSYLMVNAYPFFAYESNSDVISLDYSLFRQNPGVPDAGNGLRYFNLFDAQIDAVFAAMSALKFDDIPLVVSETGWPSKGDENEIGASVENAAAYNGNLIKRILTGGGTPLRPKANLTVFLFALFNENKKTGPTSERNYGLFYPNMQKVYNIPFTVEDLKNYRSESSPVTGGDGDGSRVSVSNPVKKGGNGSGESWCVARDVGKDKLQSSLDYACGEGGADCRPIQPGSTCYDPNTLQAHASFAFNSYYQKMGRASGACYFGGAAYVVTQPPNFGKCEFPTGY
ncbi:glucan endo-1,3-beta-glucosidase 12-like [Cynara cardunculus var. scolymus]|uniref:glucan endo-1,3-beta-D-glucosidase n=1 Tax=Cynara cardunculus var. scolymus TaxID=59895 RepID=A0A103XLQ7_CYNCS|nr:glucan endo-1,3-beta-glucosidase 12-like [Cynara cardunculus var. scolymus]KVH93092.1 Glycoside hydrolase, catalytic domain-containing protein [Cynara cardunculus var. scolymus]